MKDLENLTSPCWFNQDFRDDYQHLDYTYMYSRPNRLLLQTDLTSHFGFRRFRRVRNEKAGPVQIYEYWKSYYVYVGHIMPSL